MAIDPEQELSGNAALAKIGELVKEFPVAIMITAEAGGATTARPIGVVGDYREFDGTLWFVTDERSRKIAAIRDGAHTSLMFQDDAKGRYLYLTGHAEVVEDRDRVATLYTPIQRTWFPDGLDDPHIVAIRFRTNQGRFWEHYGGVLPMILALTKSVVTGTPGTAGDTGFAQLGSK